jgi:hypothetical protein
MPPEIINGIGQMRLVEVLPRSKTDHQSPMD